MSILKNASHLMRGDDAEKSAEKFLKKRDLKIISRNQKYKVGEIDIIAEDASGFVFVEVKYRSNNKFGSPAEMVNHNKQQRLKKAALTWTQEPDPNMAKGCRFDVIAVTNKNYTEIDWIQNAF